MDGGAAVTFDNQALVGFVSEIERQFDERKVITETLRGIYERAKTAGFVPEFLRQMVKERQMEAEARKQRRKTLDEYRLALGLLAELPLGQAAMRTAAESPIMAKPRPFAEQPVHAPPRRRGRAPKVIFDRDNPNGASRTP